ncbi:MAG: hypothetical protein JJV96_02465, partial [Alphaproteobacteria bacterium]|nr:hypothetical protein [Alphaproteobacteria bacterium]
MKHLKFLSQTLVLTCCLAIPFYDIIANNVPSKSVGMKSNRLVDGKVNRIIVEGDKGKDFYLKGDEKVFVNKKESDNSGVLNNQSMGYAIGGALIGASVPLLSTEMGYETGNTVEGIVAGGTVGYVGGNIAGGVVKGTGDGLVDSTDSNRTITSVAGGVVGAGTGGYLANSSAAKKVDDRYKQRLLEYE